MEKIGIGKENIVRIVMNSLALVVFLVALAVIYLEHINGWYSIIPISFIFLFLFAIINEFYECIFYDDTHLVIRSFSGIESIDFIDIVKIKRDFIDGKAVHGVGHWRYTVQIKTKEENAKEIVVPFPQLIHNQHLQDLFLRIKKLNKDVVWVKIES